MIDAGITCLVGLAALGLGYYMGRQSKPDPQTIQAALVKAPGLEICAATAKDVLELLAGAHQLGADTAQKQILMKGVTLGKGAQ